MKIYIFHKHMYLLCSYELSTALLLVWTRSTGIYL
jgi:hypothetical protein